MAKFTGSELKMSLVNGLSLLEGAGGVFEWATFEDIPALVENGFTFVNDEKAKLYPRMAKKKGC